MFRKKEKPTYSTWQNSIYVLSQAWVRDSSVVWVIAIQIILAVAISVVTIFLPATVVQQIINYVPVQTLITTVLLFTAGLVLLQGLKTYFDSTCFIPRTGLRVRLNTDMLDKDCETDYANLETKSYTDAKRKAFDQSMGNDNSTEQIYYCFANLGTNFLGFIVYIILLAAVNPLVLLITAASAVFGVIARQWANKWQHDHDDEQTFPSKRIMYINDLGENLTMAKDIRLFAMTNWIKDIYDANLKLAFNFRRKVQTRQLIADGIDCATTFAREGIAYAYLLLLVLNGGLSVDEFVLLFAVIGGFSAWIFGILNEYATLSMHSLNYCRVREFFEYPNKFKREDGEPIAPEEGAEYCLELKNVSFRYSGADTYALENINLVIKPGEKLAIVGLNGAGKTTLVKLLCGLYDPTEGEVLLNGKDIRIYNRDQYYTLFTAVFQEFNILAESVAANIAQKANDEINEIDKKRINQCLELADLRQKIESLPSGISSMLVKEVYLDGVELSGGETQRLMLARALYKNAPILILDEPTAALDPIAESKMYEHYNDLSHGRTSVYISHRLASTRFCDRIIMIEDKGISEMGTHDELMNLGGKYAELFEIQSKYYKEEVEF